MKTNANNRRGFTLVELLVVIVIIAALAGLTAPMVIRQRKKADQTEAVNNARQIGFSLFEFETSYGSFPDEDTAEDVVENTESTLTPLSGSYSNDFFRQLLAAEMTQSEEMFYAKTTYSSKPDNVYSTASEALEAGEVGFGYIMNDTSAFSTSGNPARPIVCAPLLESGSGVSTTEFDTDIYDAKAVVLRIDNSVRSLSILRTSKKAQLGGGKSLLTTGEDTVWGTETEPTIVPPEVK